MSANMEAGPGPGKRGLPKLRELLRRQRRDSEVRTIIGTSFFIQL